MNIIEKFLINNQDWLDLLSAVLVLVTGLVGIFSKDTIKKKKLTVGGWITFAVLILSSSVQFGLQYVEKVKGEQTQSQLTNNLKDQLKKLSTIITTTSNINSSAK